MNNILREIEREDKKNPYTDQELADLLNLKRSEIIALRKKYNILDSRERRKKVLLKDLIEVIEENKSLSERKIAEILVNKGYNISRSAISKFIKEENVYNNSVASQKKDDNKPVKNNKKNNTISQSEQDGFEDLIGIEGSLKDKINLAKSAIMYPPNGLHTIIYGETGVGKSELATCMHKYAIKNNIRTENSPFIVFNCADYAENPNLLIAQLFGVVKGAYTGADSSREGLVEKANGGILFLDEIHRLPSAGQEILFSLIDRGEYRRLGESNTNRKANVLIISATTENPDSNLLQTFRRRIPMVINLPNMSERPLSERYEIILKFFEREAKRVNKNFMITKEVMLSLMNYKCSGNIGQLKSDIQVTCARAYSRIGINNDNVIIDLDNLREYIKAGYYDSLDSRKDENDFKVDDVYIDITETLDKKNSVLSQTEMSEIYNYAEKELKLLERKCSNTDELKDMFIKKLDLKFNDIKNSRNLSNRRKFTNIENQIDEATLKIVDKVMDFLKQQYRHINQSLYLALAIHIEHAIERMKSGKNIINPSLDRIKVSMPTEYEISRYIVGILEEYTGMIFPEDELGYLAYYVNKFCFSEETIDAVKVVIVTHGKVGIEMAKVVNYILGIECTIGLEIDLSIPGYEGVENVIKELKKINAPKGILLLVDMGSLIILGDELEKRIGIHCKTISRVDTLLAMEAAKLATIQDLSLDAILVSLSKNKSYSLISTSKVNNNNSNRNKKKNIIITVCLSGVGTASKIKEHIEKSLDDVKDDIEVKALGFFGNEDLEVMLRRIEDDYNIALICGTVNIDYKDVPFIPYYDVFGSHGKNKVLDYLNSNNVIQQKSYDIQNLIHEDLILYDFEGISKEYTIDTLVSKLEEGGYVDSKYILSVYKREVMGSVVMQSKVALPHGLPEHVIKPAIAIAKLNKPIVWDEQFMVDLVVLLAMKENNKQEIRALVSKIHDENTLDNIIAAKDSKSIKSLLTCS